MDKNLIDKGWEAMTAKLDKEMPQKNRKNRLFIFLWVGLGSILILGAIGYLYTPLNNAEDSVTTSNENIIVASLDQTTSSTKIDDSNKTTFDNNNSTSETPPNIQVKHNTSTTSIVMTDASDDIVTSSIIHKTNTVGQPNTTINNGTSILTTGQEAVLSVQDVSTIDADNKEKIAARELPSPQLVQFNSLESIVPKLEKTFIPIVLDLPFQKVVTKPLVKPTFYHGVFALIKPNTDFTYVNGELGYKAGIKINKRLGLFGMLGFARQKSTNALIRKVDSKLQIDGDFSFDDEIYNSGNSDKRFSNAVYYSTPLENINRYEISLGIGAEYQVLNKLGVMAGLNFYRKINSFRIDSEFPDGVGIGVGEGTSSSSFNLSSNNDLRGTIGLKYDLTSNFAVMMGFEASVKPQYSFIVGSEYTRIKRIRNISMGVRYVF